MKAIRHARIKEIIEREIIETQEELAEALRKQHIEVTQATVSRDIKELMLIKVPTGDGIYRYAAPVERGSVFPKSRLVRLFRDSVTGMDFSENLIIVRTLPGVANAVASALDHAHWTEIIGTIAGDDNILVVVKPISETEAVLKRLEELLLSR